MGWRGKAAGAELRAEVNLTDGTRRPITVWENTEQLLGERGCGGQWGFFVGLSVTYTGTQDKQRDLSLCLCLLLIPSSFVYKHDNKRRHRQEMCLSFL